MVTPRLLHLLRIGLLTITCVALSSCGILTTQITRNHRPYRLERPLLWASSATDQPAPEGDVRIGVVEFDDQGEMWPEGDRAQIGNGTELTRVLAEIKQRSTRRPVHVVMFVHGWNNSASPSNERDGNLASFKRSLLAMRGQFSSAEIFGVYLSWRGRVLPFGDYYNRDAAAARVGRTQATAAIQAICSTAYLNERSRVTAIGHSMGGIVLLRAVGAPLVADMVRHSVNGEGPPPRPMADSIILVNPADNAIYFREMAGALKDFRAQYVHPKTRQPLPALVSITSDGDWANNYVYTLGAAVARYPLGAFMSHAGGASRSATQELATIRSIGFYPALHSHRLVENGIVRAQAEAMSQPDLIAANTRPQVAGGAISVNLRRGGELRRFTLEKAPGKLGNDTPFWMMRVPRFVVADHNDIWSDNFAALVTALDCASRAAVTPGRPGGGPPPLSPRSERPFFTQAAQVLPSLPSLTR